MVLITCYDVELSFLLWQDCLMSFHLCNEKNVFSVGIKILSDYKLVMILSLNSIRLIFWDSLFLLWGLLLLFLKYSH